MPRASRSDAATSDVTIAGRRQAAVEAKLDVAEPAPLGSRHSVPLQRGHRRSRTAPGVLDRYVTPFGIRTIEFDKDKGFLLNGRPQVNGVCMHHDLGALGAAVNRRATERQLEIMKSMGVNAIRTSHNPPVAGIAGILRPDGSAW